MLGLGAHVKTACRWVAQHSGVNLEDICENCAMQWLARSRIHFLRSLNDGTSILITPRR
jgi:hypothetical protein